VTAKGENLALAKPSSSSSFGCCWVNFLKKQNKQTNNNQMK
jgi:hypothetical protein